MTKPSDNGAWLKTHPRLRLRLASLSIEAYVVLNKVWLYCQAAGNNGRLHVDELPAAIDRLLTPAKTNKALAELMRAEREVDGTAEKVWLDLIDDHIELPQWWLDDNPGPEVWNSDVLRWRHLRNRALRSAKFEDLRTRIKHRDRNLCRYCGIRVKWDVHNSDGGGTYDHVDPDEDNTLSNVVVACRRCNGRKKDRTPDQWLADEPNQGLSLLPAGTTADQAEPVRLARAGPSASSTQARPKSKSSSRPGARPNRVEPESNRSAPPSASGSSRLATGSRHQPPPPTDEDDPGDDER